jgi:hypothetical protein
MARNENPPFTRGDTWYSGDTIDSNNLGGVELEGMEWVFEDRNPSTGARRTSRPVLCRVVRNVGAAALLPKRIARFAATAGLYGQRVDGYATTTAAEGYPVDEYLPTAGVPVNDLFWVVMSGPAVCLTSIADMSADISVGGWVVALTAATSGATTAGRVHPQVLTGSSQATDYAFLASQIQNRIGRALTAQLTTGTAADVLIDCGKW